MNLQVDCGFGVGGGGTALTEPHITINADVGDCLLDMYKKPFGILGGSLAAIGRV